jgi:hypothetical protein
MMETTSPGWIEKLMSRAANTSADLPRAANLFSTPINSIAGMTEAVVDSIILFH